MSCSNGSPASRAVASCSICSRWHTTAVARLNSPVPWPPILRPGACPTLRPSAGALRPIPRVCPMWSCTSSAQCLRGPVARRELALEVAIAGLDRFDLLILDDLAYVTKDQAETSETLASVDRLVHHATIFEMNVESYRRRAERKLGPGRPPAHATPKTIEQSSLSDNQT